MATLQYLRRRGWIAKAGVGFHRGIGGGGGGGREGAPGHGVQRGVELGPPHHLALSHSS
jgi:hypothetical protein